MALTALSSTVVLGSDWHKVSLGSMHSFYLVGIKETKGTTDTIDPVKVTRISFELGMNVGATKPLTIGNITLNFNEHTSSDKDVDAVTAMVKAMGYPSEFMMKPVQIYTDDNICHTQGSTTIGVNLLPVSFM